MCHKIHCITVRKWGFVIHQQHTCDCRSYELLRELARVYSGKAYSITIQRMADPSEERQIDGARSLHLE